MSHWIWRLLGWLIAITVGAGVTLWIYKKQSYKALSYQVVSISPLVPLEARGFSDLRLHKGDRPIERPFLTTIRITNSGDLNILGSDFSMPLTIKPIGPTFAFDPADLKAGKSAFSMFNIPYKGNAASAPLLVDARVAITNPPNIPVQLDVRGTELQIRPLLLNVGDEFTVEMLINGHVLGIEVGGRIAGVREITKEVTGSTDSRWVALLSGLLGIMTGLVSTMLLHRIWKRIQALQRVLAAATNDRSTPPPGSLS